MVHIRFFYFSQNKNKKRGLLLQIVSRWPSTAEHYNFTSKAHVKTREQCFTCL